MGENREGTGSSAVSHSGMHLPLPEACSCHLSPPAHTQVRHCPGVLTWQEGGRSLSRLPSDGSPTPTPPQCQGELSSVSRCSRLLEVALGSAPGLLSCPPSLPPDTGLTPLRTGGGTSGIEGIATWHVCGHHVGYGDMAEGLGPPATGFPRALRCWLCPLRAATSWCLDSGVCPGPCS